MNYKINGKNLSLARLIQRGKDADPRMRYMHASSKGTTVLTPYLVARVTLPSEQKVSATVWPQETIDGLLKDHGGKTLETESTVAEGRPAVTGPEYLVPKFDEVLPSPEDQIATFTCNAEILRKILKVACEVTNDADKTVRLRFNGETLRIDTWRQEGEQEFVAVLQQIEYDGDNIPGDKTGEGVTKPEVSPKQGGLALKVSSGRKFRA